MLKNVLGNIGVTLKSIIRTTLLLAGAIVLSVFSYMCRVLAIPFIVIDRAVSFARKRVGTENAEYSEVYVADYAISLYVYLVIGILSLYTYSEKIYPSLEGFSFPFYKILYDGGIIYTVGVVLTGVFIFLLKSVLLWIGSCLKGISPGNLEADKKADLNASECESEDQNQDGIYRLSDDESTMVLLVSILLVAAIHFATGADDGKYVKASLLINVFLGYFLGIKTSRNDLKEKLGKLLNVRTPAFSFLFLFTILAVLAFGFKIELDYLILPAFLLMSGMLESWFGWKNTSEVLLLIWTNVSAHMAITIAQVKAVCFMLADLTKRAIKLLIRTIVNQSKVVKRKLFREYIRIRIMLRKYAGRRNKQTPPKAS
jgi:hypothetical protein